MVKGLVTDEAVRSMPAHVDAVICVLASACRGNAQVWLHQAFAKSTGDAGSCGRKERLLHWEAVCAFSLEMQIGYKQQ